MRRFLILLAFGCLLTGQIILAADTNRPANWAIAIQTNGLSNFYKVSDRLYRSAQPTTLGMEELNRMGIKTVINLRSFHSDRRRMGNAAMTYEHMYVKAWHPEEEDVARFLRLVTDDTRAPVLVHCQHGADRTGLMCAIYRVAVQGWTKDEALKEMTGGDYHYHRMWHNLITWFNKLDVEKLRKAAGILTPAPKS
jgi:uncharacterized protein (TIGR01244 family)